MNSTLKPLLSCLPSTLSTAFSLKKQNLCMIIFSILPSPSFPKKKLTQLVILPMFPCPIPPPEKLPPPLWKSHLLPFLNWLQIMSTLMPRLMIPADSALLKFSPRTTLLNHWIHRPLMAPCLIIIMTSFTSSMINYLNIFPLSKTLRCLKTSFSPLSLALPTTSTLALVSILTSSDATFLRLRTVIRFCLYPSVQRVSGMDPLTGHLFLSISLSLSRPSLSRLYSCTPTSLLRCAPCSLHPLCSTLLVALLSLYLLLLLGIRRSR